MEANGCDSARVSWNLTQSRLCDVTIVGFSVRYQRNGAGADYTTMNTSSTNVTLQGLVPNSEYLVSVAAINSNGDLSAYSEISFNITGIYNDLLLLWAIPVCRYRLCVT